MSNLEESVTITVERRKGLCEIVVQTPGYEIYLGDSYGEMGVFIGHTPVSFYVEPKEERGTLWSTKYITVKKNGKVVKGCLGTHFTLVKGLEVGDCWSAPVISPPSGGIFIPHKGTETSLTFDIDDEWVYGWIDFYGEADRIEVYIDGVHRGVIFESSLIIYLAPGTYYVEQEAAGVRCYADHIYHNGTLYHTSEIFVRAGEESVIDSDMYNYPIGPPPQYVLDATIRHLQELEWTRLPSQWGCDTAHRKSQFTQEWCYTNKVPEVCDYERATHYWLASHPSFVFPETEVCKACIETPGYSIEIATQPGLTTPRPSTPITFNCASIPIGDGVYECTKYITLLKPTVGIVHTCNDAKIVFRKEMPGDWSIDKEKSSTCIEAFDIISTSPTNITMSINGGYQMLSGCILLPESHIPNTIYLQTPSTFVLSILNTGTITTEYKVSITFEGIDLVHKEGFESEWCNAIAPNETITLPVSVNLTREAIEEGRESATYSVYAILEAM
jgi:hypothetical protein